MRHSTLFLALLGLGYFGAGGRIAGAEPVDYTRQVKPLLAERCVSCHGPEKQRSSLRLDSIKAMQEGGNRGAVVVPGKSSESPLIKVLTAADDFPAMPPKGDRLKPEQVALLRAWIDQGAKGPADEVVQGTKGSEHWSFQPIRKVTPPVVDSPWYRNPIDAFILARLQEEGIAPSPEADRVTLIRRLSFDLIGLPPTPEEVEAFVRDDKPGAYDRLVDRLLASPHYGERWGRHWLDAARYADSNGYSIDGPRSIWPYRDWVIDALNRDMPFDQFTIEQLAGDLLPGATLSQQVATGFHRNTQINQEGGIDREQFRVESVVDRVNTTGTVWLGLTVGCCQCHDHKFDPLSQREYYQFYAFLNNVDEPTIELAPPEAIRKRNTLKARLAAVEKVLKQLEDATTETVIKWEETLSAESRALFPPEIQHILEIANNGRSEEQQQMVNDAYRNMEQTRHVVGGLGQPLVAAAQLHLLQRRRALAVEQAAINRELPVIHTTMVVKERATPRTTHIQLGGDFLRKGAKVEPQTPSVLPPLQGKGNPNRLDFARWLVSSDNPLTARVIVNRTWQRYFGLGIVETENDFGTQGTPPSHPELLDWLAGEFIRQGWSWKELHRLIVTSATYRQSSHSRPDLEVIDPRNLLLARQNRLRLEAEVVRDATLASTGLLTRDIGGPSVFPPQPDGIYRFTQVPRNWKANIGTDRYRRGMYTYFWRSAPHPGLMVFDAPDASACCTRRNRSNTPLQALTLLNDEAHFEFALALARRILDADMANDRERLEYAYHLCLGRQPSSREMKVLTGLLQRQRASFSMDTESARKVLAQKQVTFDDKPPVEAAAWAMTARVLLNLDEFITRE